MSKISERQIFVWQGHLDDLRRMVLDLTKKRVHVRFVKENLTFTGEDSPMSNLLLSLLGPWQSSKGA
jgi:hypothetical protein